MSELISGEPIRAGAAVYVGADGKAYAKHERGEIRDTDEVGWEVYDGERWLVLSQLVAQRWHAQLIIERYCDE